MILKNNSGFTLVEVVIALGISSAVFLGASSLFKTTLNSNKSSNNRIDKNVFFDEISKTVSNRLTCADSLKNLKVGDSVSVIKKRGINLFTVGQYLTKNTILKSMAIEENPGWKPIAEKYGPASLRIEIAEKGKVSTKYFPISVQLDKNKFVIGCSQKLELGSVDKDLYNKVCTEVVGGSLNGNKCRWSKPIVTIVSYIPAPPPPASGGGCVFSPEICQAYINIGREPDKIDPGGAQYWQDKLNNGDSMATVQAQMHNTVALADSIAKSLGLADSQTLLNGSPSQQAAYYKEIDPILNKH